MRHLFFLVCMLMFMVPIESSKETCTNAHQQCNCQFVDEGETRTTKSEFLAGAAGALTPLIAAGVGIGIWKLVKYSKLQRMDKSGDMSMKSMDNSKYKQFSSAIKRGSTTTDSSRRGSTDSGFVGNSKRGSIVSPLSLTDQEIYFDDDTPVDGQSRMGTSMTNFSQDSQRNSPNLDTNTPLIKERPPPPSSNFNRSSNDNINSWMHF